MKKTILSLFALCSVYIAQAQSCVSVQQISTNYTDKTVTFVLGWSGCNGANHLNAVWCFVDWCTVDAAGNRGSWTRAAMSGTPAVAGASLGNVETDGFWVTGTTSATVTVALDNVSDKFDWCTFASDCLAGHTTITCNGVSLDVKMCDAGVSVWQPGNLCPSGWRWPNSTEMTCMYNHSRTVNLNAGDYWTSSTSGWQCACWGETGGQSLAFATRDRAINCSCCGCTYKAPFTLSFLRTYELLVRCVR